ncbi:MAG: UPF0182 family protein [Geminocystis sp.]|nr:UPF0182 family protein [Geminocystis sp.]
MFIKKRLIFFLAILPLTLWLFIFLVVNILWYQEVGYLNTFLKILISRRILEITAFLISFAFLWSNLKLALRLREEYPKELPQSPEIKLYLLLPLGLFFSVIIILVIYFFTEFLLTIYRNNLFLPNFSTSSIPFQLKIIEDILDNFPTQITSILSLFLVGIFIIIKTEIALEVVSIFISVLIAIIVSRYWERFLQFFNSIAYGEKDPIFGLDISFYLFKVPVLQIIYIWVLVLNILTISKVVLLYLLSNDSISEGRFRGFSRSQLRHIYGLVSLLMFILSGGHWLNRYLLLFSSEGVVYGAGYTDIHVNLPRETLASIYTFIVGIWLSYKAIDKGENTTYYSLRKKKKGKGVISFSPLPFLVYAVLYSLGLFLAFLVQKTIVQPDELSLEKPYITNNIKATRAAFNLDKIEVRIFEPQGKLTLEDIKKNHLTIDNIRLWDTRPILQANRQLQQIRPYYVFAGADIDRYTIKNDNQVPENTQVIVAARELDTKLLPSQAQTWVNQHLVYTHGYGLTMSPVNRVAEGGLPYYFIKDIGTVEDPGALHFTSENIRRSLPPFNPRIYYGEATNDYVLVKTKVKEFDFPSGEGNAYYTYDGKGGIEIGNFWRRLVFSLYLRDWRLLLTPNLTPQTRILFRRSLTERLKAIAPFLYYDRDPYLVVAQKNPGDSNNLYWIIDGYTISAYYPYSDGGDNKFNYIRNSVKVVINAENGETNFYISDEEDPIIRVWQKIFPQLFKPLASMPDSLRRHLRYPTDYFNTQSERLLTYHVTDPQVFYNREDQWQIPEESYGNEPLAIEPYYLIMKLPIGKEEEFILLHPYTPISRANLIAWLAARSDGDYYGKLLLYQFPKERLVYGPNQIEALINQDPVISGQISLWNRQGAKAIQGHLLIIPIEQSLLYVEPVYLEADRNSVPTLARVIVAYDNQIVMASSLQKALDIIFGGGVTDESTIIRPFGDIPQ